MKRTFRLSDSTPDPRRDVRDEIAFHLEMRTREFLEQGLSPEEAQRAAAASFGDAQSVEAACRAEHARRARDDQRREWRNGLGLDLRVAVRQLRSNPAFALAATLTLALGIGATAAVLTVVSGILLRPLPYAHPERLVMVWAYSKRSPVDNQWPLSAPLYLDVRQQTRALSGIAAFRAWPATLGEGAEPEHVEGARVSPALFATLGVHPYLGRTFTENEAALGAPPVVILSWSLWQRRFGGDRSIVGRAITLSGARFTVVGVMPEGFTFPRGAELPSGLQMPLRTEIWQPLAFGQLDLAARGTLNLAAIARLAPGATFVTADSDLAGIAADEGRRFRGMEQLGLHAIPVAEQAAAPVRRGLLVLLGAVALVLLIACTNVMNLLIARTATRSRELAVRTALGAAPARLARQLITENVVLALLGGAAGMLAAHGGTRAMLSLVPGTLPRADDVTVDWRVWLATVMLVIIAGALFGAVTAAFAARRDPSTALHGGLRTTGGVERRFGRRMLVSAEIALSLVLLIGAGLLVDSFVRLTRIGPGFDAEHTLTASVGLPFNGEFNPTRDGPAWSTFFEQLHARLAALPGVRAAGAVSSLPLSGAWESSDFTVAGRPTPPPGQRDNAEYSVVSGDYFPAMRIPLLEGRRFDSRDQTASPPVVIVNHELARRLFPGTSAIGQHLLGLGFDNAAPREIVGVVGDVHQQSLDAPVAPQAYLPESQFSYPGLTLVVRTAGDPVSAVPAIRGELRAIDPTLALDQVRTLASVVDESLARQRFSMIVLGVFAGSALALALVGIYGVIALSVGQRQRELGVRLALGATPRDVLRLVLGEGGRLAAAGVGVGLAVAVAVTRVLRSLLYGTSPSDPMTFALAALAVTLVALVATWIPARRAMRVDPARILRLE